MSKVRVTINVSPSIELWIEVGDAKVEQPFELAHDVINNLRRSYEVSGINPSDRVANRHIDGGVRAQFYDPCDPLLSVTPATLYYRRW